MEYESTIAKMIQRVLETAYPSVSMSLTTLESLVGRPKDPSWGDFSMPCFALAKTLRQAPTAIANTLVTLLAEHEHELHGMGLAWVKAAGPYLNFGVDSSHLASQWLPRILDGTAIHPRPQTGRRVMVEYSQPNTHKAFHVGHTRNVALGHAVTQLLRWQGHTVIPVNYIGDVGTHVAKCLYVYLHHFDGELPETHRGEFLGQLYTKATIMLDFKLLSRCPFPGILAARVNDIQPHPTRESWRVVHVQLARTSHQVVCGGKGYKLGDLVAYAPVGSKVKGRLVSKTEKEGVVSDGMILSEAETGLSDERDRILILPENAQPGTEIAEIFRLPDALPPDQGVVETMLQRRAAVDEILKKMENGDPHISRVWKETREWSLREFREIYQWLDAPFDHFFYESDVGDQGKAMVQEYLDRGVLVRSEGAVGADLSPHGLPFLLLLKSDGTGLYATKDLALAREKFQQFHIDDSVYVVDASQSLHFQQVFKTLEIMGFTQANHCHHLAYGLVVLPSGKMSSRWGNIILFSDLRNRLTQTIRAEYLHKYENQWPPDEIEEAARIISVATIKYGMLNQDHLKDIVFDLDEWTSRSGNTGPYMLYAYARTRSILGKLGGYQLQDADLSTLQHPCEQELIAAIAQFPDTASRAGQQYRPQLICTYLFQLSRLFSRMFDQCPVIQAPHLSLKAARAALVDATGRVIQAGLNLLGITTLDRM